jgi:eukaryotic-like serine/threonine-protein kinase
MPASQSSMDESIENLLRRVSETPPVPVLRKPVRPGDTLAKGRFRIIEDLGRGGMGRVFAARDNENGQDVALKLVGRMTPQAIVHLKREFRVASELVHEHIIRLHELFRDEFEWFFTMELVRGVHLPELIRRTPAATHRDLVYAVARQLALAVNAVHEYGAVHADLKPANFLVETGAELRVVLLDFGLTRSLGDLSGGGTLEYMPPEQRAGDAVSEATDWYSFGVVIHEALTGELPAAGTVSPSLRNAPVDLQNLCRVLLCADPRQRPSGPQILEALGVDGSRSGISSSTGHRTRLIGREPEIAAFGFWLDAAPVRGPAVLLVQGASGIGKTVLVEHLLRTEQARGAIVLRGRCRENESIGYKAIDGLVDDLVALLSEMNEAEVRLVLPRAAADLLQLFPALRACSAVLDKVATDERGDQNLIRQRAILAFVDLLRNLSSFGRLIVWVDDLQWSDRESALILGALLGGSEPLAVHFVGSYRGEPGSAVPVLEALYSDGSVAVPEPTHLHLGLLREEDAEALALELLPNDVADPVAAARAIVRDAAGVPLFITELAHAAHYAPSTPSDAGPVTLSSVVTRRVNGLPPLAREVLELVAIANTPVSRAILKRVQRTHGVELDDALGVLRVNRLILTNGPRDEHTVDMRHDRVREVVARSVDAARRSQCHLSLASVLEALGGKPEEIAIHYHGAGELSRAGRYWLAAAEDSAKGLAFKTAAELYERALEHTPLDASARHDVYLRRAQMLAHSGEGPLAAQVYLARALESPRDEAIELRRRAAEQLLLCGRIEDGMRVMEEVLAATRMRLSPPGKGAIPSLLAGRFRVRLRGLRYRLRSEAELSREELSRLDVAWTMACSMGFVDYIRGADFQNRHLLLALDAGEPRRLGRALALEAMNAAAPGRGSRQRTDQLLEASRGLVERMPDSEWASGLLSLARGVAAYLHCDTEAAVLHCGDAVDTLTTRCAGAVWERVTAQRFLIAALFHSGQLARLNSLVPPLLAEAEATANLYARQFFRSGYSTASWLVRDDAAEALRQISLAEQEWRSTTYQLPEYNRLVSQTHVDLYVGDPQRAAARIREQWMMIERAQLLRIAIVRVQLLQLRSATALAAAVASERSGHAQRARELRFDARRSIAQLRRDPLPRAAPMAELLEAAMAAACGEATAARDRAEQAADSFERQGMHLFGAAARVVLSRLPGVRDGRVDAQTAREKFVAEGVVHPDKLVRVLAPGFPEA